MLAERCLEKYVKKLVGKTEMEDSLKRLDRLTQEEARMAAAENLRLTHAVDKKVEGVAVTVIAIDNRVTGVDERVAGVDEHVANVIDQVAGVDERVAGVDDRVAGVDDRVADVDGRVAGVDERVAGVVDQVAGVADQVAGVDVRVQRAANDVDEIKRLSSLNLTVLSSLTYLSL
jgi:archaellum component FlaC